MSLHLNDLAIHKNDGVSLFSALNVTLESGQVLALMGAERLRKIDFVGRRSGSP